METDSKGGGTYEKTEDSPSEILCKASSLIGQVTVKSVHWILFSTTTSSGLCMPSFS